MDKIKFLFFLMLQFSLINTIYSQGIIEGIVSEVETRIPLPDTYVYIENTSLATVTNNDGVFKLVIPKEYIDKKIIFSLLGFKTEKLEIFSLLNQRGFKIMLKPATEILDEVIISANNSTELDGTAIVKKAFENYSQNFPETAYLAKGFMRHTERTDIEYKWLTEVAFEMYDTGQKEDIVINVLESRKSIDSRKFDTVARLRAYLKDVTNNGFRKRNKRAQNYKENFDDGFVAEAFAYYDNQFTAGYDKKKGLIKKILSWNKIRNYNHKDATFTDENLNKIKFGKDTIISFNEDKTYKIKFSITYNDYPRLGIGWLYIRARDFAIVEMDYSLILGKGDHYRKATGIKVHHTTNIKYQEFNNKIYPFYISFKSFKLSRMPSSLKNDDLLDGTYSHDEILFSEIITNEEKVKKASENLKTWEGNMFTNRPYNPSFWENYNVLLETEEQQKLISDLEKNISLKKQFEQE